jgi:hypothetical protein
VLLIGPEAIWGDLVVDGGEQDGAWAVPPALGGGIAGPASEGATLDTGLPTIQPYLIGHWVQARDAFGQARGIWRIAAISEGLLTLEANAEHGVPDVQAGDRWDGIYRLDSLLVTGRAKVTIGDLLDAGDVQVDAGSTLVLRPEIEAGAVSITAHDGAFWVAGGDGAVSETASVSSARLVNLDSTASAPVSLDAAGGFAETAVSGASGQTMALELSLSGGLVVSAGLGTLPANLEAPLVSPALVRFEVAPDSAAHLVGQAGAVADGSPPIALEIRNDITAQTWDVAAAADGSFDALIATGFADTFSVRATDGHPEPLSTTVVLIDSVAPEVDGQRLADAVHDRAYWISGDAGAVLDDLGAARVGLRNLDQGLLGSPVVVAADGSFAEVTVPAAVGESLELVATDVAGNETTLALIGVPGNDGPPLIDPAWLLTSADTGTYEISYDESCWTASQAPLASPDGLWLVQLENRTTPVFGPTAAAVVSDASHPGMFGIDPLTVDGAVGDEIWIVAEDGHPEPRASEVTLWTLPTPVEAPWVALGQDSLVWDGSSYWLSIPAGAVTDDNGPLSLWLEVWHPGGEGWIQVLTGSASIASGDAVDLELTGELAAGDLVLLWVTDADGGGEASRTTVARIGELPPQAATVRLSTSEILVAEPAGQVLVTAEVVPAPDTTVSVGYATADGTALESQDYLPASGTLYFDSETTSQTIAVTVYDDSVVRGDRDLTLSLSDASGVLIGQPSTIRIVIVEDDTARAGSAAATAVGNGPVPRPAGPVAPGTAPRTTLRRLRGDRPPQPQGPSPDVPDRHQPEIQGETS